jgi:hypothetical protein|nr:MAG TPA: hypothetical protein [Caudoviricetes sp.]
MLIRSQNKEVLATLELLFDIEVSGGVISARRDMSWCCLLGEYSTKAKAMKVLDMIQEAYEEYETERIYKEGVFKIRTFQMPEDSEVEV